MTFSRLLFKNDVYLLARNFNLKKKKHHLSECRLFMLFRAELCPLVQVWKTLYEVFRPSAILSREIVESSQAKIF